VYLYTLKSKGTSILNNQTKRIQKKKKTRERRIAEQKQTQQFQKSKPKIDPHELLGSLALLKKHDARTPVVVTKEIECFASKFGSDQRFYEIESNVKDCNPNQCFLNVAGRVKSHGGKMILGQAIYENEYWLETELHAIWMSYDGEVLDITPVTNGESRRYIVIDPNAKYDGFFGPKHFYPKVSGARNFCEVASENYRILERYKPGEQLSDDDLERTFELIIESGRELSRLLGSSKVRVRFC
jgi:hypothetical protein